jgi:hypothetical protein
MKTTRYLSVGGAMLAAGLLLVVSAPSAFCEGRAAGGADRKAKIAERKAAASEARETRQTEREEKVAELRAKGEQNTDNREERQSKRIQHGIKKGYLTESEAQALTVQQESIAAIEASFKSDGKMTKDEYTTLRSELNKASRSIWAEKHDTEGNQMAVYRLGSNVFASAAFTEKLANTDMTKAEAKSLAAEFRRMMELKKSLSGDPSDADRSILQAEFDDLLNQYFEVK